MLHVVLVRHRAGDELAGESSYGVHCFMDFNVFVNIYVIRL